MRSFIFVKYFGSALFISQTAKKKPLAISSGVVGSLICSRTCEICCLPPSTKNSLRRKIRSIQVFDESNLLIVYYSQFRKSNLQRPCLSTFLVQRRVLSC